MDNLRVVKVIRVGTSLAVVLPANLCRELNIARGSRFVIQVADEATLLLIKAKVVNAEDTGLQNDPALPTIKNGECGAKDFS